MLVLGALSAIAEATARLHATRGDMLVLVARDGDRLESLKQDMLVRGAQGCLAVSLDLAAQSDIETTLRTVLPEGRRVDVAYIFYGVLGDQTRSERDINFALQNLNVNFNSASAWSLAIANVLEAQASGVLIAISSVAGDRGRQSNYVYGAAKAGLSTLIQGISHRLARSGAHAVAVKLGFVDTPMTAHIHPKGMLWAQPEKIAAKLVVIADKPSRTIVYLPWFWWPIMAVIKAVPSLIFHRTKL